MKKLDKFPCDINHPLLSIIDSDTRRNILQLIAAEPNYGNRLASILKLSCPSIHRHLKRLQHFVVGENEIQLLGEKATTSESYSGHKGAEATLYEIVSNMGLFFGVFPNFVHSQIVELDQTGEKIQKKIDPDDFDPNLFGAEFQLGESVSNECTGEDCFENQVIKIQQINEQIREQQESLMKLMFIKNEIVEKVNGTLEEVDDLSFKERIVLKSLIVYGCNNIRHIAKLLNTSENDIHYVVRKLRDKKWIVDKNVIKLNI